MPYRENADSLQRVLDDAIELAMAPQGTYLLRLDEVRRTLERVEHAIALGDANAGGGGGGGGDGELVASLRRVHDVVRRKRDDARSGRFAGRKVNPAEQRAAKTSPRGELLRIIEITLNEPSVRMAEGIVRRRVNDPTPLGDHSRMRLAKAVELLRERFDSARSLWQRALLEPCTEAHEQLLEPIVFRLEHDAVRVAEARSKGLARLERA